MIKKMEKKEIIKNLCVIPGVGVKTAEDFINLGIKSLKELKDKNPEELYERLCVIKGTKIDRCQLYVFRCAVYFVSNNKHDVEKLLWWNWKDK
jgi:hypothetical protein